MSCNVWNSPYATGSVCSVNSHLANASVLDSPSLGATPLRRITLVRHYSLLLMVYLAKWTAWLPLNHPLRLDQEC